jgi:hypothetical protein
LTLGLPVGAIFSLTGSNTATILRARRNTSNANTTNI